MHLTAGLSRVRLDRRGLVYLHPDELAQLAQDFARAFAGSGFSLTPASPRELLLLTPGVEAVATAEPARFAGAEVNEALPRGPAAAGLRRTWTEMEMWLHAQRIEPGPGGAGDRAVALGCAGDSGAACADGGPRQGRRHLPRTRTCAVCGTFAGLHTSRCPRACTALDGDDRRVVLVLEAGSFMQVQAEVSQRRSRSWMRATWHPPWRRCAPAASTGCA